MGTSMGPCSGSPGPGGGRLILLPPASIPTTDTRARPGSPPPLPALARSPLPARGAARRPSRVWVRTGFVLPQAHCPHNRHVRRFLLCHPLSSLLGGLGETLSSPGSFPCSGAFLGHRGPLDAPHAFYAQGSGPSYVVGVSEGGDTSSSPSLPSPSPASPVPWPRGLPLLSPLPSLSSSWIPFSQTAKHLPLPAPSALVSSGFLQDSSHPSQARPLQGAGAG